MVTAAGMLFPQEMDNIEITTPLTTQPTTHNPLLSYHVSSNALTLPVCRVWGNMPCKGKLLKLAALQKAWQVCVLCQLLPPDSALGLLWCFSWKNPQDVAVSPVGQGLGAAATYWQRLSNCRSRISYCSQLATTQVLASLGLHMTLCSEQ